MTAPLNGRMALVTGVSRRVGIGHGLVRRLLADGASVLATGWSPHDAEMPWGADPAGDEAVIAGLDPADGRLAHVAADLADPAVPARLVGEAIDRFGGLDIVVANHARSSHLGLADTTADDLDRAWAVNVRATLLLVQAFAAAHAGTRPGGRVVLFTSGQHLQPMPGELAYAVSKGALQQVTASLADAVADLGITVNCVNPGPVDTGYASDAQREAARRRFPAGRWGTPDDVANLVAFLVGDEAAWITGQVLNSEGGFRRHGG